MTIEISTAGAIQRLWEQAGIVLLTNFLKAGLASIAISILFEWSVGRHLRNVAAHVRQTSWQDASDSISLNRQGERQDDIAQIVQAIHSAKQRARGDFERLNSEIAARKETQSKLESRTQELLNANREQAEFTYAISHDMKSPANTIRLLVDDLKSQDGMLDEDAIEVLDDMGLTATRMSNLIDDVLGYASAIEPEVRFTSVDLQAVFDEICADLKGDIRKQKATVTASNLPTVQGDRTQLRLLLQNLIANALKFRSPDRDPVIRVEASTTPQTVTLDVIDNGIGISSEHFDRIFGMFKRLHAQSEFEGTGLGLTLCRRVVLNHNGTISVSSELGKGTRFRIELNSHAKRTQDDPDSNSDRRRGS